MSSTAVQLIIEALARLRGVVGHAATAEAVGNDYIQDAGEFSHSELGDTEFQDRFVWRYNLPGTTDEVRQATTVDTDLERLSVSGNIIYQDNTDLDYMLLGIHPYDIMACLATAQRKQYVEQLAMLNVGTDLDMKTPGTDYWDGTSGGSSKSNLTPTKTTVAANVFDPGGQALLLTATGTLGYTRGELIRVSPQRSVTTAAIVRADVGTITMKMYDATNGAFVQAGNDVAYTGEQFALLVRQDNVPSGCEHLQVQFSLTGASDIGIVDSVFGPFDPQQSVFTLPSWLNESFKLPFVRMTDYRSAISGTNNAYDAYSRVFNGDYKLGQHYQVEAFSGQRLAFENGVSLPSRFPLWLAAERSLADTEPLLYPSSVTTAPFEQVLAYFLWELADLLEKRRPGDPRWPQLKAEQSLNVGQQTVSRPGPQALPERRIIRVGI